MSSILESNGCFYIYVLSNHRNHGLHFFLFISFVTPCVVVTTQCCMEWGSKFELLWVKNSSEETLLNFRWEYFIIEEDLCTWLILVVWCHHFQKKIFNFTEKKKHDLQQHYICWCQKTSKRNKELNLSYKDYIQRFCIFSMKSILLKWCWWTQEKDRNSLKISALLKNKV